MQEIVASASDFERINDRYGDFARGAPVPERNTQSLQDWQAWRVFAGFARPTSSLIQSPLFNFSFAIFVPTSYRSRPRTQSTEPH